MRVALLGALLVEHEGVPVAIGGQRLRALFIRLALEPGRWVSATTPRGCALGRRGHPRGPAQCAAIIVSRLRRPLPDPTLMESSGSGYRLRLTPADVDVSCFESLAAQGRSLLAGDQPEAAARALDEANGLWNGPPFADLDGAVFIQPYVHRAGAMAALQHAHAMAEQQGSASIVAMTAFAIGHHLGGSEPPEEARVFIRQAIDRAELAPNMARQVLAGMYTSLSRIERLDGQFEAARGYAGKAWSLAHQARDMPVVAVSGVTAAAIVLAQGDAVSAVRLLGAADSIRGAADLSDPDAKALIAQARSPG